MEISDVRKRVLDTIERAKRARRRAARRERRSRRAAFERASSSSVAVPLFRQVAQCAARPKATRSRVFTPARQRAPDVRQAAPRTSSSSSLDTSGDEPQVDRPHAAAARPARARVANGRCGAGPTRAVTEDDVLAFLLKELEPFVER